MFPEAVQLRKDKFLEVDYNGIHALHIECLKSFEELEEIREDIRKSKVINNDIICREAK